MKNSAPAAVAPAAIPPDVSAPASAAPTAKPRFAALQSRNFRLLWFGMLVSNAGTWMESTASGWLVTDLEPARASFWLGLIAAAFAIPMIVLPPFGGAIADRYSRIKLLWIVQTGYLILSAIVAALVIADAITVWMLVVYSFAIGVVLAVDSPTRHAFLPDILSREQLPSGVSLNSVAFTGAALVGPAIAGVLIPVIGVGGVMVINVVSCLATLYALTQLRDIPQHAPRSNSGEGIWASIMRGVDYIRSSAALSGLILISTLSGLLIRSYGPLLAVFARDEFGVGSTAYGILVSAGGLGTLIGAFGLAGRREVESKGRLVAVTTVVQAVLLLGFALSPWFLAGVPLLALIGVMNAIAGATIATLIQLAVPGELRGRVMSLYLLTVVGVPSVGSFLLGAAAVPFGVRTVVGVAAAVMVIAAVLVFARNKPLRSAT